MDRDMEMNVPRANQQGLHTPSMSLVGDQVTSTTAAKSTNFLQYTFPDGRPISTCSIESVGSFVCSEASSWLSADFDDDCLLHAVHRLSMSSCSSWTVSELGDDQAIEGHYVIDDDGDDRSVGTDQLIEDSLLTLAYLNGDGDKTNTAMSCQATTASDSSTVVSGDSVMTPVTPNHLKDMASKKTLRENRQSRIIEDCDLDFKVKLDITIDDARVAQAFLIQQDSTLLAMSEARILQLPFLKETISTPTTPTTPKSPMSKQMCGLTGSKTLNRLGKIPDVAAAATRSMATRKQVAHLHFWERITSNALSNDTTKRRSMLY